MELKAFELQMDRLRTSFGEKHFPKNSEREMVFWERLKFCEAHQFQSAISYLIAESFLPPTLSKIMEAMNHFRPSAKGNSSLPDTAPDNPHARRLAEEYGSKIKELIRGIGRALPYDQESREDIVPTPEGGFLTETWIRNNPERFEELTGAIRDGRKVRKGQ